MAPEVEGAVLGRLAALLSEPETIATLTDKANALLAKGKPAVEKRIRGLKRSLRGLDGEARRVAGGLAHATAESAGLINQQLSDLTARRDELATALREAELGLVAFDDRCVTPDEVLAGLRDFQRVFAQASKQANHGTRFAELLGWLPDVDSNHEHRG